MKKIIGVLGVAMIAATMFFNANNVNNFSLDSSLTSLLTMNAANAEETSGSDGGCTYFREKLTSQQLVCTAVNGSLAANAGIHIGMIKSNSNASLAAKAEATWELKNCYMIHCYANSGTSCCTPQDWTICHTAGC